MVPVSVIFHCGFSVPRGSGALHSMVLLASCFALYITVDVLSPILISSFDGFILHWVRVGLSSGAFSESSLSVDTWLSDCRSFCVGSLYCMSSSGSDSCSMSHIAACVSTGCFINLQSEAIFLFVYMISFVCLVLLLCSRVRCLVF